MRLSTEIHDRDAAGFVHVYPVVSRRAQGVSIGINLNPNRACNWRCLYCQVEGLQRGAAPAIDLGLLEHELETFLHAVVNGDYMERHVPEESRRLNDVAFSGNGEPTTSKQFAECVTAVSGVLERFDLLGKLKLVLITNGSLVQRPEVQRGLAVLATGGGEVWFKLDAATRAGRQLLNDVDLPDARVEENLALCSLLCPTRLQTMALALDGEPPSEADQRAWLELVQRLLEQGVVLRDVLLYGLERKAFQPEAPRLSKLPTEWLEAFAQRIRALGLEVHVHP